MGRYIDAEKIKVTADTMIADGECYVPLAAVKQAIARAPTEDVQEVRHGRWMYCGKLRGHDHGWQCSECLRTEFTKHKEDIKDYPYCHCGAKMDREGKK